VGLIPILTTKHYKQFKLTIKNKTMKKQKFSIKNLLFKSAREFQSWFAYITKKFKDMIIMSCKKVNGKFLYKIKYSI
jgi:hypothetical protein